MIKMGESKNNIQNNITVSENQLKWKVGTVTFQLEDILYQLHIRRLVSSLTSS
jgi:hypothetical protein